MVWHKSGIEIPDEFEGQGTEYTLGDGWEKAKRWEKAIVYTTALTGAGLPITGGLLAAMEFREKARSEEGANKAIGDIIRTKYPDASMHYSGFNLQDHLPQQPYPQQMMADVQQPPQPPYPDPSQMMHQHHMQQQRAVQMAQQQQATMRQSPRMMPNKPNELPSKDLLAEPSYLPQTAEYMEQSRYAGMGVR